MNRPPLVPYRPTTEEPGPEPVVAPVTDESPEELQLRPVECPSRHELLGQAFPPALPPEEAPVEQPRIRFSLLELLVVTAAISVGLAGGKWMLAEIFALFMGAVTVAGLFIVELYPPESRGGWLAWTAIVLAYLAAWMSALAS